MHLIESYEAGEGWILVDERTIQLKDSPLLAYEDILSYEPESYTLTLSDNGKEAMFDQNVYGEAFAIVVDDQIVYTGFIWPGYFSMACNWVIIDPLFLSLGNKVNVDLGYPVS